MVADHRRDDWYRMFRKLVPSSVVIALHMLTPIQLMQLDMELLKQNGFSIL
jgi:hypothetical protein